MMKILVTAQYLLLRMLRVGKSGSLTDMNIPSGSGKQIPTQLLNYSITMRMHVNLNFDPVPIFYYQCLPPSTIIFLLLNIALALYKEDGSDHEDDTDDDEDDDEAD